ncbi:MAG: metallophosphoesterase [Methylovulum sp.]|nr:metallophosphoesterase [Methylovulum sp.]
MNDPTATTNLKLELITKPRADRPNRLCVVVSDLHFTDGTVGFQNLNDYTWDAFYSTILQRCLTYRINELVLVLDGDIVDMIRSSKWAQKGIYPWQRERKQCFSAVVNAILKDIIEVKHASFFKWLRELEINLIADTRQTLAKVKIVITVGNHDKEMLCDNEALTYFYEQGLGIKLIDIDDDRRKMMGNMYGDENLFTDKKTAPYLPFYYGDTGFRFFTTHGQWRDPDNSAAIPPENGLPGWSAKDGWSIETWQQLKFAPFLKPCFGDTVAAGVLSTFIYQTKKRMAAQGYDDPEITSVLDELDLYRPSYAAIERILELAAKNRADPTRSGIVAIIEDTLYECLMAWLGWDFTLASSPAPRKTLLIAAKWSLKLIKLLGHSLNMGAIAGMIKLLKFGNHHDTTPTFQEMASFPSFLPGYLHYGFQIHGEGHTHVPLQGEANIKDEQHRSTYINFGTWRDQIILRAEEGYRRRGMLRALFILDLENLTATKDKYPRSFDYFVTDVLTWSDLNDNMMETGKTASKI